MTAKSRGEALRDYVARRLLLMIPTFLGITLVTFVLCQVVLEDRLEAQRRSAKEKSWLAYAVARQGRRDEAKALVGPVLAFERSLAARADNDDQYQRRELVIALLASALADPAAGKSLLDEAEKAFQRLRAAFRGASGAVFTGQRLAEARHLQP